MVFKRIGLKLSAFEKKSKVRKSKICPNTEPKTKKNNIQYIQKLPICREPIHMKDKSEYMLANVIIQSKVSE